MHRARHGTIHFTGPFPHNEFLPNMTPREIFEAWSGSTLEEWETHHWIKAPDAYGWVQWTG
jgi:hypothetical protein